MGDEFYSLEQMAEFFGISPATMRNRLYMKKGVPPFINPAKGVYRFPKKEFDRWVKENTEKEIG
jgi:predicted site-specific integrase-resolvase